MKHFNEYKQLNLAELSKQILEQWEKEDLFHKSIETREGNPSFLFFEGPPSANGMPGIHHVQSKTPSAVSKPCRGIKSSVKLVGTPTVCL